MPHLLVIGSLNMDLIAAAPHLPQPGETVIGATFSMAAGGKGANQAVAAARMGAPVKMIGRIGDDEFGHRVRAELADNGVDVAHVGVDPDAATATGHIVIDPQGRNSIVVASGANARLSEQDVQRAEHAWRDVGVVALQLEVPLTANWAAVRRARELGARVVLNAAPMDLRARELIAACDELVLNEVEAEQLAGEPITNPADAIDFALAMRTGDQRVIVTIGAQGAVLVSSSARLHQPAPQVNVIDTTAAGDAFVGTFAAALLAGASESEALQQAVLAGSWTCTSLGAIPSLPAKAELRQLAAQGPSAV